MGRVGIPLINAPTQGALGPLHRTSFSVNALTVDHCFRKLYSCDVSLFGAAGWFGKTPARPIPAIDHKTLVKGIVSHMPRVRSLIILDRDVGHLIANASAAPRPRSLYVGRGLDSDDFMAPPFHPAKWAPNLRNVDLMCSRFIWKEPMWNNLEHLRIDTGDLVPGLPMQEIPTILEASPGLRSLEITGIFPPGQSPLPVVKLEALESLTFDTTANGSPVEALNSIIALPTARCRVFFDGSDETQVQSTLQSICRIASGIVDGQAGRKLKLTAPRQNNRFTIGGFKVHPKQEVLT